jgi:hypothetical protein
MLLGTVGADLLLATDGGIKVSVTWGTSGGLPLYLNDVTSKVRPNASPVTMEYGRDQSTALTPTVAGRGGFVLDNRSRFYSPRNTSSPLYGLMKPARPVQITRQIGSTIYQLFDGHTDDSPINPDIDSRTVSLSLVDWLADFRARNISTPVYRDIRTGDAINYILDACGWQGGRDIDLGATIIPWWWEDNASASEALEKVVRSEGPPALLSVGVGGAITFRDRHHRILRPQSATSQDVWHASGVVEPVMAKGFTYDEGWSQIINTGTASVDVRKVGPRQVIWDSDGPFTMAPGEQRIMTITPSDPVINVEEPVPFVDWDIVGSGGFAATPLRSSGASIPMLLQANSQGASITGMRVFGQPVSVGYTQQVSAEDATSIQSYGARSFPGDLPWCGLEDAKSVLGLAVGIRSKPLPVLSVRFVIGNNFDRCRQVLERDIGDRVTVVENQTGLNTDFYIESIKHEFTSEYDHAVTFGLEMVPGENSQRPIFRLDTPGAGANQGYVGSGLNDGITTDFFRLDTVGQGLNQGVLVA